MIWFVIAIGGALGAISRHAVGLAYHQWLGGVFPGGTLLVNVLGSFLIGGGSFWLLSATGENIPVWRAFLLVGFLGAFTTFSSFSLETLALFQRGAWGLASVNVLANVSACLLAVTMGAWMVKQF